MKYASSHLAPWLLPVLLASCAHAPAENPLVVRELGGTKWTGIVEGDMPATQLPRLEFFADGKLMGYTGCNTLRGSFTVTGDRLEIVAITTKRGCDGLAGRVEQRFLEVITGSPRVKVGARDLTITSASGTRFDFRETP
jgi:heat shock protein HslJ